MAEITVQLEIDGPITLIDESFLIKTTGGIDNENEMTEWVEYRLKSDPDNPRAVHRAAHVRLKKGVIAKGIASSLR